MNSHAMPSEIVARSAPSEFVSMANYRAVMACASMDGADSGEGVSVQLRKATDAAGTGAVDHGTAGTASSTGTNQNVTAYAEALAEDLGDDGSGNAYTHVACVITKTPGSPAPAEEAGGVVLRFGGRFRP